MNAPDLGNVVWKKSSRSSGNGQCTEIASFGNQVAVRDSKDPNGPVLVFTPGAWATFVISISSERR
ncbi:uncharacterized protein DUF397 [Micromonospora pisi]|uniref:Uncharacterized protein DUF397 n=1 Tax=Micromonospora pisi TaxID=589240 RepID=A0A495JIH3_9ACTN|nr:DUF397 domain-containing protein [Micromonospora pisi]RKR88122.1 uncharacterized protein DUF397 [Micromonospora pisi]